MDRYIFNMIFGLIVVTQSIASEVRIQRVQGDVRIRQGMEETWTAARNGMVLKSMDTIFSGEASEVMLVLEDESTFSLGGNAILDISDLRRITERQLFLFLMSQKVGRLNVPSSPKIHIANVSVVRGSQKGENSDQVSVQNNDWIRESNGAKALFKATYYTNAIMKFYKILERYPTLEDQGEIHFYLGQAFENLEEKGRAQSAYQTALENIKITNQDQRVLDRKIQIEKALNRLKLDGPSE